MDLSEVDISKPLMVLHNGTQKTVEFCFQSVALVILAMSQVKGLSPR